MITYFELIERLKKVKELGYVKTHRTGNTGIGKTLEDLLGIKENNIPGPNALKTELKSARKSGSSMLTLFTKSPSPPIANSVLLQKYGYELLEGNKRKKLHTTVNAVRFNYLKGKPGFKINAEEDRLCLVNPQNEILGYWGKDILRNSFEKKLPEILYVKAETKDSGTNELFWFNEAWLLKGFDFDSFIALLKKGIILVDIRIGQYPDGRTHDHGTGFRVLPNQLDLCFQHRKKVM
jgi:hypothetical protein